MTQFREPLSARGERWTASRGARILLIVLFVAAIRSTLISIAKPFWYDELCTVLVSRLPGAPAIWNALRQGADGQPLPYYMIVRFFQRFVPDDHLAARLPSILGLLATVTVTYFILAKRVSQLSALIGASFVLCTILAGYGCEARPYALLLACVSAAVFCWQRIDESMFWALLTAISLAAAVSVHYYAFLVWPAFILAELSVLAARRRLRWAAWLALAAGITPYLFLAPVLLEYRRNFAAHFSSLPSAMQVFYSHDWLFEVSAHWGWSFAVLVTVFLVTARPRAVRLGSQAHSGAGLASLPLEELILILTLLWLPAIAVLVVKLGHGGMTLRYMLPAVLGGALAVGCAIERAPAFWQKLLLLVLVVQFGAPGFSQVKSALTGSLLEQRRSAALEVANIESRAGDPGLPVVIADGLQYLPTLYYAPVDEKTRLFYVADPRAALQFSNAKSDTLDLTYVAQEQASLVQTWNYESFLAAHQRFILVASQDWDFQWLPARLVHDGYTLRFLSGANGNSIFDVNLAPSHEPPVGMPAAQN